MSKFSHPEFEKLAVESSNQSCFDCGINNSSWASVNNAIYLCIDCAGIHRGFGVEISYVRSITMDKWKENHIKLMKRGGNKRLKEFLKKIGFNENLLKQDLYFSKILNYYRSLLKSEITGDTPPNIIDTHEYFDSIRKDKKISIENFNSISSSPIISQKLKGRLLNIPITIGILIVLTASFFYFKK